MCPSEHFLVASPNNIYIYVILFEYGSQWNTGAVSKERQQLNEASGGAFELRQALLQGSDF